MKKLIILLFFLALCFNYAKAQQANERDQKVNQITTKEINEQKVTTGFERERIKRDAQIESMKPDRTPQSNSGEEKVDKPEKEHVDKPEIEHVDKPEIEHIDKPEIEHIDKPERQFPEGHDPK